MKHLILTDTLTPTHVGGDIRSWRGRHQLSFAGALTTTFTILVMNCIEIYYSYFARRIVGGHIMHII
jgi:hypothetical protein